MLTYEAAIKYIYKFTDYEKKTDYLYASENFDLSRMECLLTLLGSPHQKMQTVHVAGSKGKGSTSSMIASILEAQGYRVGLFTSPHLHTFRERIRVNGSLISPVEVAEAIEEIQPQANRVKGITTFEIITALSLFYFNQRQTDIAVMEVGLGGRLDATNVIIPEVSVITSISYDHMHLLGNTLAEIAGEKAGIIKTGIPVVSAPQQNDALTTIKAVCKQQQADLTLVGQDWTWEREKFDLEGQSFRVCSQNEEASLAQICLKLWLPLMGEHQIVNATTAVATVHVLKEKGWDIFNHNIALGLRRVHWPGRLEILNHEPLIIIDSAHNADSARKLILALKENFGNRPIMLIFGASSDKDIEGMLREFLPNSKSIIFTRTDHPRAGDPQKLRNIAEKLAGDGYVSQSMEGALELALKLSDPDDLICATGSVFVAANLREVWAVKNGQELDEWQS